MRMKQTQDNLFDSVVHESFYKSGDTYTLEKRSDNLFMVRVNNKETLALTSIYEKAKTEYDRLKPIVKGGENMPEETKNGIAAARAQAEKLKTQDTEKKQLAVVNMEKVKNQLLAMQQNPELAKLYKESVHLGSANISAKLPYLRIHTANSLNNELYDGTIPNDGWFYYSSLRKQYKELRAHILTISRGFRVLQKDDKGNDKEQFNQLVGGVLIDTTGEFKPFIMYINGMKCQPLWDFAKVAAEYKRMNIPMFSLVVELTTERVKTEKYGYKWVPKFTIAMESDVPEMVLDVDTFKFLRNGVETTETMIEDIIQQVAIPDKATETTTTTAEELRPDPVHEPEPESVVTVTATPIDDVSPDQIPF